MQAFQTNFCPWGPPKERACLVRRYQKRIDELLLHCIDEGRPPCLRSCGCPDTPAHRVPIEVKLPLPAATWPLRWPGLWPVRYPLLGLYQPRGHENSHGPVRCDVLRGMRGSFTRACEVSGDNEEIDDPVRRRDRGELRRHHEATDGAHPSAILGLLGLHLEVATGDERQCLGG